MAFDAEAIRAEFPILSRQVNGKPLVYLDSAASAQKPRAVIEAMARAMEQSYANVHRGLHTLANETTDAYEAARASVARFINAESVDNIVFIKGGTEAINLVASGLGATIQAGDEIIISQAEHHANIVPWHFLRERQGAFLRWIPVLDDGTLDMEAYKALLNDKTKVVAVSHMSNVTGVINPVAEIVRLAREAGAVTIIDGCQGVVHLPVDVQAIGADFYAFSAHKLYGPTGIGALYGRTEALASLRPYQGGGEMIGVVSMDRITYAEPPHRFEAGTPPIIEAIGFGAAVEWMSRFDRAEIAAYERKLYDRAVERLAGHNWLRIIGEAEEKGAIMAFTVEGAHAHDVAQILDRHGVAVRAGTHCAEPLMARFGITSSARASFALYNTEAEADVFVDALVKAHSLFG
ncbi:cysteine desulfurase [Caulobacter segnis]|uniref:aminotransferase class V-fold PLP-dependent enzyme n=1 Tax=Caulobacter segnis TaxID=88688 RepID=UPI0024106C64|nr:cysteine desulfurase [Caulobacter segnis]MDG2521774.1 cysteine desulfurase [Caulobacter segnis]